jgi:hypothetical protein
MTKVDVEGTPLKIGDFVWAALGPYNQLKKYEIIGETKVAIKVKWGNAKWEKQLLFDCNNKVLKVKD